MKHRLGPPRVRWLRPAPCRTVGGISQAKWLWAPKGPWWGSWGPSGEKGLGRAGMMDECVVTKLMQSFAKRCFKAFKCGEAKELEEGAL